MRKINEKEFKLIKKIIPNGMHSFYSDDFLRGVTVDYSDDGGMGGLIFFPERKDRKFGSILGDCSFRDRDGAWVLASIFLDENGELFELDMWRSDFKRLIDLPD